MEYIKKPLIIEAFKFGKDEKPEWFNEAIKNNKIIISDKKGNLECEIQTPDNIIIVNDGDYIVRGANGEIHSLNQKYFEENYKLNE